MIWKLLGAFLIIFAFFDFAMSYLGTDIWGEWFSIDLEEPYLTFSPAISGIPGFLIFNYGWRNAGK